MDMTQMQLMNTGTRETVPFLDTMFGAARRPTYVLKKVTRTLRWFAKVRGSRRKPAHDAYVKGPTQGYT